MSFAKSALFLVILSLILNSADVAGTGTLSLHSSLERSNREFACPQESVAITCSVDGTGLAWAQPDGSTIGLFRQTSAVGSGFSDDSVNCSQAGRARAAGILEDISPIYISTVILIPLSPDCVSLSLTCKSISKPEMNITYKVAARPSTPTHEHNITCSCDVYKQPCITVLQVTTNKNGILTQNQDTSEINLVTLKVLEADVQQLSISPNTNSESDFITANFSYTECVRDERFHVNITIVDKCGQQSSPITVECEPCEQSDGSMSPFYDHGCWLQLIGVTVTVLILIVM